MVLSLLDVAQAYDDVVRETLQELASEMDSELGWVVSKLSHLYSSMVTHVKTAYRLSRGYPQVGIII